jgi:hypothetical protein
LKKGGGVALNDSSTFTMSGGEISDNTAPLWAGGVYLYNSAFTMSGNAKILDNEAALGGGVYIHIAATFTMENGLIKGNKAKTGDGHGGGVAAESSAFYMNGGEIAENSAKYNGGGVHLAYNAAFTFRDGSISGNTSAYSGGVNVWNGSSFTMEGGVIKGNAATVSGGGGVGVNSGQNNRFTKKGGTIYGDTDTTHIPGTDENTVANGRGHAVFIGVSPAKYRNDNAGPETPLYAANSDGVWTFADTSADGAGDTGGNWQTAP